jgi:hypothetical protein
VLHLPLDGPFTDAEPCRNRIVVEILRDAQQEDLPATRLELEQCLLHDCETAAEVDDDLQRGFTARELIGRSVVDARLSAPPKTVPREIGRDLVEVRARAAVRFVQVHDVEQSCIGLLQRILGIGAVREQPLEIAQQRVPVTLEELAHEPCVLVRGRGRCNARRRGSRVRGARRRGSVCGHPMCLAA